jgi:hypothetical protein
MGLAVKLIEDDSLRVTGQGYEVKVRLNWYRSIPLSCVERVRLALDDQWAEPEALTFGINERTYSLDELPALVDESWFMVDSATIHARQPGQASVGRPHTVAVEIAFRVPYMPIGPDSFLVRTDRYSTTLVAR